MTTKNAAKGVPQRFSLRADGRTYALETSGHLATTMRLLVDGDEVGKRSESGDRGRLTSPDGSATVEILRTSTGRVRRATLKLHGSKGDEREFDLDPEPGSPAARRLARERRRPVVYGVLDVLVAALGILLPLLGLGALIKLWLKPLLEWLAGLVPDVDLPDLPSIPWPDIDLPDIPWPDIPWPSIDLSWLPDPPDWLIWALDHLETLWPVILAAVLARREVTRRRAQDALKARLADEERQAMLSRLAAAMRQVADGDNDSPTCTRELTDIAHERH